MKDWTEVLSNYNYGDLVEGIVIHHTHYGVFLEIEKNVLGLIEANNFLDEGSISKDNFPPIGSKIAGVIIDFSEHDRSRQIRLSARPSEIANAH